MVHAEETSLQDLLEGTKQYLVPLYQRTYSWRQPQHDRLWDDVLKLAEDRSCGQSSATHFIGSLVLAPSPANGPTGVQQFLVVDGQQRLTTLSVLLCAIRDHRAKTEDPEHRDRVNEQYLINKWKQGALRPKLLPTQTDRPSYQACLDSTPHAGGGDAIGAAYRFFRARLEAADDPDDVHDIERIEEAVISGLSLVSVTAQAGDNVHRIFESLNNTGLRLTQGDLLRNYLFMRLPTTGDTVYESLWLPLQQSLSSEQLETLFWLDLVRRDPRVKQADSYASQQARLDRLGSEAEIEAEVVRFAGLGRLFANILRPEDEKDPDVRRGLERLNAWGTTTVYPLVLEMLDRREHGTTTDADVAQALTYIESFLVRRLLTGRATNNVNRVLLGAVAELRSDRPLDAAVHSYLSAGRKYYATDAELRQAIESQPFYWSGKPHQKALVLRWLEESYGSKEPVDIEHLTIEHVLPQTPTTAWRQMLASSLEAGEDAEEVYASLVHTLGNLTLTGYNSTLSNSSFDVKREKLVTSGLLMNQEIAAQEHWSRPQIVGRARSLSELAVKLWPGPAEGIETDVSALWKLMNQALAELPAGCWTTYGDLAVLIGSHPVPVGMRLAAHPAPNAHRVLQAAGTISVNFRWLDPQCTDDPMDLLREEGVLFDDAGHADPGQRVTAEELAELVGLSTDGLLVVPDPALGTTSDRRDQFVEQLAAQNDATTVSGVLLLLGRWIELGGSLSYGEGKRTSCFLMARPVGHPAGSIWPLAIYPYGRAEVVFQHLAARPPFDESTMREELRSRLNTVPGIDLAASKIQMRPSFDLEIVADLPRRSTVGDVLGWFISICAD
jgi:alkylated DNA nucleotide flippase Atl1